MITNKKPNKNYQEMFPWYDGYWLYSYVKCKQIISVKYPEKLQNFIQSFEILKSDKSFKTKELSCVISEQIHQELLKVISDIKQNEFEKHEFFDFGRLIKHDLPYITKLQERLVDLVSTEVGEEVEVSYNFLSLYNSLGILHAHMDAAPAKWTLDYCIDQSAIWPIYLSKVQDWPENFKLEENWEEKILADTSNEFQKFELIPKKAILFSGSSQWHYRERITLKNEKHFCHLVFFHFIPKGSKTLCHPKKWAEHFGISELSELVIDL